MKTTTQVNHIDEFINEQMQKTQKFFIGFTIAIPAILSVLFAVIDSI